MQQTKAYEFGDSVAHMDIPGIAGQRHAPRRAGAAGAAEAGRHRHPPARATTPSAATCVLLDMRGSMRYDGQYVNVKRMGLALDGLIRSEYPGDFLQFIEMYTFAKPRHVSEVAELMPKPVTIYDPVVRLKADMSDPDISEMHIPPHFTNIQHAPADWPGSSWRRRTRRTGRSCSSPTACRRPTSRAACCTCSTRPTRGPRRRRCARRMLCAREGITINIFLLPSWNQSEEDVRFAYRMAEIDEGPRVLHRRPRPGPLRRLGLHQAAEADCELRRTVRRERAESLRSQTRPAHAGPFARAFDTSPSRSIGFSCQEVTPGSGFI